jgi:hypothetical protein
MYHAFADFAEWKSCSILGCRSSDPFAVEALAVRSGAGLHLLIANLTWQPRRVMLGPLGTERVRLRHLDGRSAPFAMHDPERFRATAESARVEASELLLELAPYAVVRLDATPGS